MRFMLVQNEYCKIILLFSFSLAEVKNWKTFFLGNMKICLVGLINCLVTEFVGGDRIFSVQISDYSYVFWGYIHTLCVHMPYIQNAEINNLY